MATTWGGESGYARVGIDIIQSPSTVTSSTTSVTLTVIYYVQAVQRGMDDNQTLTLTGAQTGSINYYMYSPFNATTTKEVARRSWTVGISYSSGYSFSVGAQVSGMYNGGTPSHSRSWSVPKRPASVPSAPGTPTISSLSGTSATWTWTAPSSDGGAAISEYWTSITRSSDKKIIWEGSTGTTRSKTITGLARGTSYYVAAQPRNVAGWGAASGNRTFTTYDYPAAPATPKVTGAGQTDGSVSWTAPSNGGTAITGYDVQIASNSSFTGATQTSQTTLSKAFTGLTVDTTYYVRVRAKNAEGAGAWSSAASFRTFYEDLSTYPTKTPSISIASSFSTARPILYVDVKENHPFDIGTRTIQYQFAQNTAFTTDVTQAVIDFSSRGTYGKVSGDPNPSFPTTSAFWMAIYDTLSKQGTWYVRARAGGTNGMPWSAWTSAVSFTVSHTPGASTVKPIGGAFLEYASQMPFTFTSTDSWTSDKITAYEIVIEDSASGAVKVSTNKVTFTAPQALGTHGVTVAIPSNLIDTTLRWRVRVWDTTGVVSAWSDYAVFTPVRAPIPRITFPTEGQVIDTGRPTFKWDATLTLGRTISSTKITVMEQGGISAVWTQTTGANVKQATPSAPILLNTVIYTVTVEVTDNKGLKGSVTNTFSTSFVSPDPIAYDVNASLLNEEGYVEIQWIGTKLDPGLAAMRVYRREVPEGDWELAGELTDLSRQSFHDYMIRSGRNYMWSVTQIADRFGELLESPVGMVIENGVTQAESRMFRAVVDHYWLIAPEDENLSTALPGTTGDSNTEEYEQAEYNLIGRGRHVDYGDRLGYTGTLTVQIRQPEIESPLRKKIEDLRRRQTTYYLRTPFGKLFPVALGNLGWAPKAGTGLAEMGDLEIPYSEVG